MNTVNINTRNRWRKAAWTRRWIIVVAALLLSRGLAGSGEKQIPPHRLIFFGQMFGFGMTTSIYVLAKSSTYGWVIRWQWGKLAL
jgi:hypothetical protein